MENGKWCGFIQRQLRAAVAEKEAALATLSALQQETDALVRRTVGEKDGVAAAAHSQV